MRRPLARLADTVLARADGDPLEHPREAVLTVRKVVQAALADVADVHVRPLADGLEPFQHLDGVGSVLAAGGSGGAGGVLGGFQGRPRAFLRGVLGA